MSHHNYTNPAFCQQSEFYGQPSATPNSNVSAPTSASTARVHRSQSMRSIHHQRQSRAAQLQQQQHPRSEQKPVRSANGGYAAKPAGQVNLSARYAAAAAAASIVNNNASVPDGFALVPLSELPPRAHYGSRYAFVPAQQAATMLSQHRQSPDQLHYRSVSQHRLARSQDDLDRYAGSAVGTDGESSIADSSFTSLPPQPTQQPAATAAYGTRAAGHRGHRMPASAASAAAASHHQPQLHSSTRNNSATSVMRSSQQQLPSSANTSIASASTGASAPRLKSAFSTDFVPNRSLILVDQASQQRYTIVPTAENEELVDAHEEIIQMHNGRAHRYAVIPTDASDESDGERGEEEVPEEMDEEPEEMETCLSSGDFESFGRYAGAGGQADKYATIKCAPPGFHQSQLSLQMQQQQQQQQLQQRPQTAGASHTITPQAQATQKLFEILSTPRKPLSGQPQPQQQQGTPTALQQQQQQHMRTPQQQSQTPLPQKYYESPPHVAPPSRYQHQQQQQQQAPITPQHQHHYTGIGGGGVLTSTPNQQPAHYQQPHHQQQLPPQRLCYDQPPPPTLQQRTAQQSRLPKPKQHHQHHHQQQQHQPPPPPPTPQRPAAGGDQRRTTAVITPRLARNGPATVRRHHQYDIDVDGEDSCSDEDTCSQMDEKSAAAAEAAHSVSVKMRRATATIGAVSLMLMLCGAMNSALCMYMIAVFGRLYYLDLGILTGFATVSLGALGFRSRHSQWLPNRNYVSGYTLVTVFSLLNCCGLLVLLAQRPTPGTPLHDVTTGVILGLSSLTLLVISLGVITSRWCRGPPPDNRVEVYNTTY